MMDTESGTGLTAPRRRWAQRALVPIVVGFASVFGWLAYEAQRAETGLLLAERATRTFVEQDWLGEHVRTGRDRIARFMVERIADARSWGRNPVAVAAAITAADYHAASGLDGMEIATVEAQIGEKKSFGTSPEAERWLVEELNASEYFAELFFTDRHGYNVAITNPTSDFVQSDEGWWQSAWRTGLHVGMVEFDESSQSWSTDISVAVGPTRTPVGVIKTVLDIGWTNREAVRTQVKLPGSSVWISSGDRERWVAYAGPEHEPIPDTETLTARYVMLSDLVAGAGDDDATLRLTDGTTFAYARTRSANLQNRLWTLMVTLPPGSDPAWTESLARAAGSARMSIHKTALGLCVLFLWTVGWSLIALSRGSRNSTHAQPTGIKQ